MLRGLQCSCTEMCLKSQRCRFIGHRRSLAATSAATSATLPPLLALSESAMERKPRSLASARTLLCSAASVPTASRALHMRK